MHKLKIRRESCIVFSYFNYALQCINNHDRYRKEIIRCPLTATAQALITFFSLILDKLHASLNAMLP